MIPIESGIDSNHTDNPAPTGDPPAPGDGVAMRPQGHAARAGLCDRRPPGLRFDLHDDLLHHAREVFQQSRLSSQFAFQYCNLPQLLNNQKNVPFHLKL